MSTTTPDLQAKAKNLAALFNHARAQGLGFLRYTPKPMSLASAEVLLGASGSTHFDYLHGRVLKLTIEADPAAIRTALYDRDNGQGAAAAALACKGCDRCTAGEQ